MPWEPGKDSRTCRSGLLYDVKEKINLLIVVILQFSMGRILFLGSVSPNFFPANESFQQQIPLRSLVAQFVIYIYIVSIWLSKLQKPKLNRSFYHVILFFSQSRKNPSSIRPLCSGKLVLITKKYLMLGSKRKAWYSLDGKIWLFEFYSMFKKKI